MNRKVLAGIILVVFAISALIFTIFEANLANENQKTYEINSLIPGWEQSEEGKNAEKTIELQRTVAGLCFISFIVLIVLGIALIWKGNKEIESEKQALYRQEAGSNREINPRNEGTPFEKIERLKILRDRGAITEEEFQRKKKEILEKI